MAIRDAQIKDALEMLHRLAVNTERIADALEAMNQNDPIAAILKATESQTQAAQQNERDIQPPDWMRR